MLRQRIEQDVKAALLAGDSAQVSVLRSLKSAITYAEVAKGVKGGVGLSEEEIIEALSKEAKKRQESADVFAANGQQPRADQELSEKAIIERYLPPLATEEETSALVDKAIDELGTELGMQMMGRVISRVKQESQVRIDGAVVARLVKERLQK